MISRKRVVFISASMVLATAAQAQIVVYTNLTPNTFLSTSPWVFSKSSGLPSFSMAQGFQFKTTGAGTLTTADVALKNVSGSDDVTAELFSDSGGDPGSVLASASATVSSTAALVTFNFASGPSLTSGTDYWLVMSTPTAGSDDWLRNGNGATGIRSANGADMPVAVMGAFDVQVATPLATPEPAPMAALGLGVLALVRSRKRR